MNNQETLSPDPNLAYEKIDDPLETFIVPFEAQRRLGLEAIVAAQKKEEDI